jgi:hypothetical protein
MTAAGSGFYGLASYAECTERYPADGPLAGGAAIVVAPGTGNERLFQWGQVDEAVTYATSINVTQLDNVPLISMCKQAVEELYAV